MGEFKTAVLRVGIKPTPTRPCHLRNQCVSILYPPAGGSGWFRIFVVGFGSNADEDALFVGNWLVLTHLYATQDVLIYCIFHCSSGFFYLDLLHLAHAG